jgi:hypothetical protein
MTYRSENIRVAHNRVFGHAIGKPELEAMRVEAAKAVLHAQACCMALESAEVDYWQQWFFSHVGQPISDQPLISVWNVGEKFERVKALRIDCVDGMPRLVFATKTSKRTWCKRESSTELPCNVFAYEDDCVL